MRLVATLKYILFLCVFTLIAAEILLRIFNPIPFRVKGDKIMLPRNQKIIIENKKILSLAPVIYHTKNNMGFRGPEVPANLKDYISIITVGGSTTESYYISDSLTWSYRLYEKLQGDFPNVWLNNAGLDGHSTYGHKMLLKDHLLSLQPDYILFMVGCNDVERDDLHKMDQMQGGLSIQKEKNNSFTFLKNHSELASLIENIRRSNQARRRNLLHEDLAPRIAAHDTITISESEAEAVLKRQGPYLAGFRNRLDELVAICLEHGIQPILLTQASLFGTGTDPETGGSLENTRLNDGTNGKLYWQRLELYNDVVRELAQSRGLLLIDLARIVPKSSRYFYDTVHFTNEGSALVAELVYEQLANYLKMKLIIN